MKKSIIIFYLTLNLIGCAYYTLVEPKRTKIGEVYTINPQILWSRHISGNTQIWTVDGSTLQELRFINGIEDNESPFEIPYLHLHRNEKSLQFRKDMRLLEIKGLVIDGLSAMGGYQIKVKKTDPIQFGIYDGIRVEVEYVTDEGFEKLGMVVGAIIKEKLYLITYFGARIHYFSKYKAHVDKLIASIQMNGNHTTGQ